MTVVPTVVGKTVLAAAVGIHSVDFIVSIPIRYERNTSAVRRPIRVHISTATTNNVVGKTNYICAVRIHG